MKILVLHGHLSMGGEERVLLNVLRNLVELNYDVDLLITWNHKENNLFENEIPDTNKTSIIINFFTFPPKIYNYYIKYFINYSL